MSNKGKRFKFILFALTASALFSMTTMGACKEKGLDSSSSNSISEEKENAFELTLFNKTLLPHENFTLGIEGIDDMTGVAWFTSDKSVATVENGYVLAKKAGTAVITAVKDDQSSSCTVNVETTQVKPLLMTNVMNGVLNINTVFSFSLRPQISYNLNNYTDFSAEYFSTDESIVIVSNEGEIRGIKEGTANVIVTANWRNGMVLTEVLTIHVLDSAFVTIDKTAVELYAHSPEGYDFKTSEKISLKLSEFEEEQDVTFFAEEVGGMSGSVAVYEDGMIKATGKGNTSFVFICEYKGKMYQSEILNVTVTHPNVILEEDIYALAGENVEVLLSNAVPDVKIIENVKVDGKSVEVIDNKIVLNSPSYGAHEVRFYADGIDFEYKTDIVIADRFISTKEEFLALKTGDTGYYVLTNDLQFDGENIGNRFYSTWYAGCKGEYNNFTARDKGFKGTLDGNGHSIYNMSVNGYGLFGIVSPEGVIKNLGVKIDNVVKNEVGFAVATEFYGTMENCSFYIDTEVGHAPIGILQASAKIKNTVFYTTKVGTGGYYHMGAYQEGVSLRENIVVVSNKGAGASHDDMTTGTTYFNVANYKEIIGRFDWSAFLLTGDFEMDEELKIAFVKMSSADIA